MKLWNRLGASLAIIALAAVAFGQTTTTPPATCAAPATGLTALNFERVIPLADILYTLTPNAPVSLLAALAGGALEIHEILIYNPQLGTVTSTLFAVAAGSPLPTPNFNFTTGVIQVSTVKVSQILFGCSPVPSMLIVGTGSTTSGVFGAYTNVPAAISIGYTTDSPPKINNVAEVAAGVAVAWSATASGTLTVPAAPTVPPPPGTGPTIIVTYSNGSVTTPAMPNTTIQAGSSPFLLNASSSTGNGALTFAWSSSANSPVAFVATSTPGQILVQFPGPGDYTINLTVKDSTGASSTFSVTLEFLGRPQ